MRDVSHKFNTLRTATASAILRARPETIRMIQEGRVPKGDPLPVAKVAAIQAAKMTPQLIPYCHPVPVEFVGVEFLLGEREIEVHCTVKAVYKTGVEMEALTGASAAALNLYDMLKMLDDDLEIVLVRLLSKSGGKTELKADRPDRIKAGIVVVSDSVHEGKAEDLSGAILRDRLSEDGVEVAEIRLVPDDQAAIAACVTDLVDRLGLPMVVTTGGTGVGPRDVTPEAVRPLLDRELPGVAEALRAYGQARTPYAMLSRTVAGVRGKSIVVCLPGSPSGVTDGLEVLFPYVLHTLRVLEGARHERAEAQT